MNFNPSSSKSEFVSSIKSFSQKSTEELFLMALKSDPNFKEKLIFCLKNNMRNFRILTRAVENLKTCTLIDYFCRKYVMFQLNKYRGAVSEK